MSAAMARLLAVGSLGFLAVLLGWSTLKSEEKPAGSAAGTMSPSWRLEPTEVRVIDGDTVRLRGEGPSVRLVGFNAPETRRAECPAERELGDRATRRLREIVRAGELTFEAVPCACPAGTEGTPACNYGRSCGTLRSEGRDVGAILIAEGLAVSFACGPTRCPATPRPWCK